MSVYLKDKYYLTEDPSIFVYLARSTTLARGDVLGVWIYLGGESGVTGWRNTSYVGYTSLNRDGLFKHPETRKTIKVIDDPFDELPSYTTSLNKTRHKTKEKPMNYLSNRDYSVADIYEEGKQYILVETESQNVEGCDSLEDAKTKAQKQLKQGEKYVIFKAVATISPKPLDALVEDL